MKFFQSVATIEELKKAYRKLSLKLHPDREGGNEKAFIQMKDEYDILFKRLQYASKGTEKAFDNESSAEYMDIIDAIINFDLDIEIIGTWVWVAGNTYNCKDKLKELGFKWAKQKKMWYWHSGEYTRKNRKNFSIDQIREMHGSEQVKSRSNRVLT